MNYDMVKYERGQVWVIRHKQKDNSVGHEQLKDRPWLILSVGKFNKSSGMVTAVPLTTRDKARTISQVQFSNDRGDNNIIMCEQIKTFDYSSGAYIFDFMGQLSADIMEKVDVALSMHLGMHYSPLTLNKLYDSMEAILKSVGYLQDKDKSPKFTDDDVIQFAEKLQTLAGVSAHSEISATQHLDQDPMDESRGIPESEEEEDPSNNAEPSLIKPYYMSPTEDPKKSEEVIDSSSAKAPRIRWTKSTCEEFLKDHASMPMSKVMSKWNISKKTRYYSTKNYVQNLLTKMTQE